MRRTLLSCRPVRAAISARPRAPAASAGASRDGPAGTGRASGPRARSAARPRWAGAWPPRSTRQARRSGHGSSRARAIRCLRQRSRNRLPRQPGEERLELGAVGEVPRRRPGAPSRTSAQTDCTTSIESNFARSRPDLAADQDPEIRLVFPEHLLGRGRVAAVQPFEQHVEVCGAHVSSRAQARGGPGAG